MEKKKIFYGIFCDFNQKNLSPEQMKDISKVFKWCDEKNIYYTFQKEEYENEFLHLYIAQGVWMIDKMAVAEELVDYVKRNGLVPFVCVKNYKKDKFMNKLAQMDQKFTESYHWLAKKYNDIFIHNFDVLNGMDDVIEPYTGGVVFKDYEWYIMEKNSLKDIFDAEDNKGAKIYSVPLDNGIMLRGATVYYYFACFTDAYQYTTKEIVNQWADNCYGFLSATEKALNGFEVKDSFSRRLLLALIDNLRNIQLIVLNAMILTCHRGENVLFNVKETNNNYVLNWYRVLDETLHSFRDICFSKENDILILSNIIRIIKEMKQIFYNSIKYLTKNNEIGFTFEKCIGLFRDTDNFLEEFIVLEDVFATMEKQKRIEWDKVEVVGVLSGAIELPCIAKLIRPSMENIGISYVFQNNGMYMDKQEVNLSYCYNNVNCNDFSYYKGREIFLLDDNIMSGLTVQLIINELYYKEIEVKCIISICRPDLNRLPQMEHFRKAFNIELIGIYILGMLSNVYYTKVPENTNYLGMFTDGIGMYSQRIARYLIPLYKNGCFKKKSQVDVVKGYVEGR